MTDTQRVIDLSAYKVSDTVTFENRKCTVNIDSQSRKYLTIGSHAPKENKLYAYDMTTDRFADLQRELYIKHNVLALTVSELNNFCYLNAKIEAEVVKADVTDAKLEEHIAKAVTAKMSYLDILKKMSEAKIDKLRALNLVIAHMFKSNMSEADIKSTLLAQNIVAEADKEKAFAMLFPKKEEALFSF